MIEKRHLERRCMGIQLVIDLLDRHCIGNIEFTRKGCGHRVLQISSQVSHNRFLLKFYLLLIPWASPIGSRYFCYGLQAVIRGGDPQYSQKSSCVGTAAGRTGPTFCRRSDLLRFVRHGVPFRHSADGLFFACTPHSAFGRSPHPSDGICGIPHNPPGQRGLHRAFWDDPSENGSSERAAVHSTQSCC